MAKEDKKDLKEKMEKKTREVTEKVAGNISKNKKEKTAESVKKAINEKDKTDVKKVKKKIHDKAIANGFGLKISPKQCKYVCRVIRGKSPEAAIKRLQAVIDEERPIPMAGLEVGHKKGNGLAGGKFPKNACKGIMEIVKQAGANALVLEIENPIIAIAKSNQASAPYRKAGRKAKRTHIYIEIRNKIKTMEARKK